MRKYEFAIFMWFWHNFDRDWVTKKLLGRRERANDDTFNFFVSNYCDDLLLFLYEGTCHWSFKRDKKKTEFLEEIEKVLRKGISEGIDYQEIMGMVYFKSHHLRFLSLKGKINKMAIVECILLQYQILRI